MNRFMLYHLFQTAISKDVTLHVSANNTAMVKKIIGDDIYIYTLLLILICT